MRPPVTKSGPLVHQCGGACLEKVGPRVRSARPRNPRRLVRQAQLHNRVRRVGALGRPSPGSCERNPCTVARSASPTSRSSFVIAMSLSGRPGRRQATGRLDRTRLVATRACSSTASAASDSGWRCSIPPFILEPGIRHSRAPVWISSQTAPLEPRPLRARSQNREIPETRVAQPGTRWTPPRYAAPPGPSV